jgi:hydroxymethylbilane synthase
VEGLAITAIPERESVRDVMISPVSDSLRSLPDGARVGTGSLRRKAQLLNARPDLTVLDIRGNVETRLKKLDDGEYDAILLAEAGLKRLGLDNRITEILPLATILPAVGQGALALETRVDNATARAALEPLNHLETFAAVTAERALLAALRAGCLAPVGAWARVEDGALVLEAVVLSGDGRQRLYVKSQGTLGDAFALGQNAANELLSQGAAEMIASAKTN